MKAFKSLLDALMVSVSIDKRRLNLSMLMNLIVDRKTTMARMKPYVSSQTPIVTKFTNLPDKAAERHFKEFDER